MLGANSLSDSSLATQRACGELSRKLRAGHDCRAEDFLKDQPAIGDDSDAVLELLYTEFIVREQLGQQPQPQEWLDRFPQWQHELSQVFEVHALVDGGDTHIEGQFDTQREPFPIDADSVLVATNRRTIGGYEILQEIGRGGMGVVYQARQRGLGRVVALKMILSPHDERERARFRTEAEATARLSHPNIVPIYEVGLEDGCPFLSMEFVAGPSLEKRLAEAVLAPRAAADLVQTLARAVSYAHEQGIIHRDLKPANVLLKDEGGGINAESNSASSPILHPSSLIPKITDFGLAKTIADGESKLQSVAIVGTPSYMPPEQCAANGVISPAVDVYALGAILYEALTGRPPFRGSTALDILELVRTREPVPPSRLAANIPRDLETICLKCLAKQPEQRYASAHDLAEDLHRFLADEPIRARPVGRIERSVRWCRRNPLVAALVGGIALLLVGGSIVSTSLAVWAVREKDRANQHADQELAARELAEYRFGQAEQAVGKYLDGIEKDPRLQEADFSNLRKDLLASAVPFYEEFVATKPGDAELEAKRGRAYGRLGFIRKQMGALDQATADYERMRDIFVRLNANSEAYRTDLAQCHYQLGWTLADRGQLLRAETEYQRSLDLYVRLAEESPHEHSHRHRVAIGYRSLGLLWNALSRRPAAEQALREALTRLEKLTADHPEVARYQEDMAGLHTFLANALPNDSQEAKETHYRRSVELYKELTKEHPHRPEHRFGLATARNNLGAWHEIHRRHDAAHLELEEALALRKQLAAEFPSVPSHKQLLAVAHQNLGMSWRAAKRLDEAEQELRSAIVLLEQQSANYPAAPDSWRALAFAHEEQASVLQGLGRPAESEREQRTALQIRQRLMEEYPDVPLNRILLANCHTTLGATMHRVGRYDEAEPEFAAAIEIRQKYDKEFSDDLENVRQLALCLEQRAQTLQRLNRRPATIAAYREALGLWTERLAGTTASPAQHFEAGRGIASLAALLDKAGALDEAVQLLAIAAERHTSALHGDNKNAAYANALWKDFFDLASVNNRRKDHSAAAKAAIKLAAVRPSSGEDAVWAARYFGRCVVLAQQDRQLTDTESQDLAQWYGDQGMEYLHEAVKRGYRDMAALTKLEALAPLVQRTDFQQLLAEQQAP